MASMDEHILRTAKEIVVKFIETGRVSPTSFSDSFTNVYNTVQAVVKGEQEVQETEKNSE